MNMAPIKHGVSIFYITSVLATLIMFLPFLLHHEASVEQIKSALSKLSKIGGTGEDAGLIIANKVEVTLEDVLAQASMANKTVIITTLNEAWAANNSMIDIFLESFHAGENIERLLHHLVIVCVDQKAYDRCIQLHPHCFQLKTIGIDFTAEKAFMSEDFLKMMWRRIEFLGEVLQLGYSFLFSDGDILWFRDPFAVFSDKMDFQVSTDRFAGRPFDLNNWPNSGFLFARSNQRTIKMYKYWYEARLRKPTMNDQQVLKSIFREQDFVRLRVKVQFFDTVYFAGFCQVSRDMRRVVTMHSNCCIGLNSKLHDLRLALDDWRSFKNADSSTEANITHLRRWRVPFECDYHLTGN